MRSVSATVTCRGTLDENGPLEHAQRLATSRSSRRSFLPPVNEAADDNDAYPEYVDDHALYSSDEEIENLQRQSRVSAARRASVESSKSTYRREAGVPRTHRLSSQSRRLSLRPPLQNVSRDGNGGRRLSLDPSGDLIGTTLNEKKQRKLVALFYWRRRTLETYLSAWKSVVFNSVSNDAQRHRNHELTRLREYSPAPVRPVALSDKAPYHRSALLQNTMHRRRSDLESNPNQQPNHRDRLNSLRDEYRQLRAIALERQASSDVQPKQPPQPLEDVSATRNAFRDRLRMYYVYFDAWQEFIVERRADFARLETQALLHHKRRQLRKFFRRWAGPFIVLRRTQKQEWQRACKRGDRLVRRRRFRSWMRVHKWYNALRQRAVAITHLRMAHSLSRWHRWTVRTCRLRFCISRQRQIVLKRFFSRLRAYLHYRRQKKARCDSLNARSERRLLRLVWVAWHHLIFAEEECSRLVSLSLVLSKKSAVRKWKRFVARRRECQLRAEQADYRLYEGLLRRFWCRWLQYLVVRSEQQHVYDRATRHWAIHHKQRAIRALLSGRCARKYERDRGLGALQFYHRRVMNKVLLAWGAQAAMMLRSRHFRSSRVKRTFAQCFLVWRQFTKRSQHINSVGAALRLHNRARERRRILKMWLYQCKLQVAYRILDSRYLAQLLSKHLTLWKCALIHRRRVKSSILGFQKRQKLLVLHGILLVWHRFAAGSRCRRRLARLFEKKCLCKKLRVCVKVLACTAKSQRLQRSIERRRVEGAWHAWVTFVADQHRQSRSSFSARQFYLTRRYTHAVGLWKMNARRWIRKRQLNSKAIRCLIQRTMQKTFWAWYKVGEVCRRQRERITEYEVWNQRSRLRKCFLQWNVAVRSFCRERQRFQRIWCRSMVRLRERAFYAWRSFINHRNGRRQVLWHVKHTRTIRYHRAILRVWRKSTSELKRQRLAAQAVHSRVRSRLLRDVFDVWHARARQMHRDRTNTMKAASFHREFLILWVFYGWQHAVLERQVLRHKQRRCMECVARRLLCRGVSAWKRRLDLHRNNKQRILQAVLFYNTRRRRDGINAWSKLLVQRRERRERANRACAFAANILKRRIFRAWLHYSSSTRTFKLKLRVIFQTGEDSVQKKAFRCWRRYKRTPTLEHRASQWRQKSLVKTVWRHWRQQVAFSRKMRANVVITNRLLQNNTSRTSFTRWKRFAEMHRQAVCAIAQADEFHKARCYRSALKQFRVAVRHARAVALSSSFHSTHMQRQYFMNWRRGIVAQRYWRARKISVVKQYRMLRKKTVLTCWRQVVQTKFDLLQSKVERYRNSLVVRHAWKAWKRVLFCQHLVEKLIVRRMARALRTAFCEWVRFRQDQQLIRFHVEAAVAHIDRVVKQKIWERWMQFLAERREYHRLEDVASSFYTTNILLNRCMNRWSNHIVNRHERRSFRLQANALYTTTSLRKCLNYLKLYVDHRRRREAIKAQENEEIRQMVVSRAICQWRNRVSTLRSLVIAGLRANQFYMRRAEKNAIRMLVEHASVKKKKRKSQADAHKHQTTRLIFQCFTRWKSFLTWRRRHRHLLRLFRSYQLNDYFALWRKYVVRCQHKRWLQETATRGYCNLVQRGAFRCWVERCHYWRGKQRAIQWYHHRLGLHVLEVWAHRVCVLRKMRHMFRFQDSFRLETHFATWKRYWWRKKQQVVRVQDAARWFKRHRAEKCFVLWVQWVETRRLEKETLRMAIGFRKRFFSLKYFRAWRFVAEWKRRNAWIVEKAQRCLHHKLYHRAFDKLRAFAKLKKRLSDTSIMLTELLVGMKIQRCVDRWTQCVLQSKGKRDLTMRATEYRTRILSLKIWCQLRKWYSIRRVKRGKWKLAEHHNDHTICRHALAAWVFHVRNQHRLRTGLKRFKDRYFRSVVDDCFFRWSTFVRLKRQLRRIKSKVERSRQRRVFEAWSAITLESRKCRAALAAIHFRRTQVLLSRCVIHWESVTTENWMYKRFVRAAVQRRERRIKSYVWKRWKSLLSMRQARERWRENARSRHKPLLIGILHQWQRLAQASDGGSERSTTSSCR